MQNADTAKTYCPLRHEIHINMHFVFFNENEYEVCVFSTCYLSFSYFTIHVYDIFDTELKDFCTELQIDFVHIDTHAHTVYLLYYTYSVFTNTHTGTTQRKIHTYELYATVATKHI